MGLVNSFRRALLTVSALTAVTGFATSAIAQTAGGPSPAADASTTATSLTGQPVLNEIVVTAQRRSENIQKVPISLTALSGNDLQRLSVKEPKNLEFAVPGLTFPEDNTTINPYIRGRGTGFAGSGLEGSIAIYLDDVYAETQLGTGGLTDMAQIQVLKGPQGTLYGRNATGGAILFKTNDPTHQFEGHIEAGYGNLNMWQVNGVLNVPITESFAVRVAGSHENRDGFLHDVVDGNKIGKNTHTDIRVKALWEPSDRFSAVASVDFQKLKSDYLRKQIIDGTNQPTGLGFYETQQSPTISGSSAALLNRDIGIINFHDIWTTNLHLTYKGDKVTVTSITGYRSYFQTGCTDNDNVYGYYDLFCIQATPNAPHANAIPGNWDHTFSEELRAATKLDGPLNFTLGAVYQNTKDRFPAVIQGSIFGGLEPVFDNFTNLQNYSVYGEAYYTIAPGLKLTAGARWSKDSRQLFVQNNADLAVAFGIPAAFFEPTIHQTISFSNVTPRVVLDYDAGDANYYVSYNKGFKSGGFNVPALATQTPLKPETINSFEVGAKFKMLDNRVRLDLALFTSKSKNVQVASINDQTNSVVQQNAAGVSAKGGEASLTIAASERLTLNLGASYLHSRFTSFPDASVYQLGADELIEQGSENLKGFATSNSPAVTANGSATYEIDLPGGWSASATLAGRYSSAYSFQAGAGGPLRYDRQKAFGVVNLTGDIVTPDKHITISWYVNNMFQTHYYDQVQTGANVGGAGVDGGRAGGVYGVPALPRTFGGAVRYSF